MTRSLSVRKLERRAAFARAVAARAEMLAMVDDRPYLYDAAGKRLAMRQDKSKREPKLLAS